MMQERPGLVNIGNTCYMNAVIQCLNHIKFKDLILKEHGGELVNSLKKIFIQLEGDTSQGNKGKMYLVFPTDKYLRAGEKLYFSEKDIKYNNKNDLYKYNDSVNPNELKYIIDRRIGKFIGYDTHDCAEFLACLLDLLNKECNLSNLFLIKFRITSEITNYRNSTSCFGISKSKYMDNIIDDDKSFYLDIPIKENHREIKDCINDYLKYKKIYGNVQGYEKIKFMNLPEILVINLRRINKSYYYSDFINYPKTINLSDLLDSQENKLTSSVHSGYNFRINNNFYNYNNNYSKTKDKNYEYQLKAFIIHKGHPLEGHKIAICYDENEDIWYSCDDEKVIQCQYPFRQEVAFLFFYEKI